MFGILATSFGIATHLSSDEHHRPPTHAAMLREHERRKGAELRRLARQRQRFGWW